MNNLIGNTLRRSFFFNYSITRNITVSAVNRIKKVDITQNNDELIVKAAIVPSGREKLLVPEYTECAKNGIHFCPECTLNLDIKHTDVLILSQYIRDDGCMLPRRTTGLCKRMQKRIGTMVTMAQKAGLMPNIGPRSSKRDPEKRFEWKKFNKYFDESTIREPGKKNFKWTNYKHNMAYAKVKHLL